MHALRLCHFNEAKRDLPSWYPTTALGELPSVNFLNILSLTALIQNALRLFNILDLILFNILDLMGYQSGYQVLFVGAFYRQMLPN